MVFFWTTNTVENMGSWHGNIDPAQLYKRLHDTRHTHTHTHTTLNTHTYTSKKLTTHTLHSTNTHEGTHSRHTSAQIDAHTHTHTHKTHKGVTAAWLSITMATLRVREGRTRVLHIF